MYFNGVNINYEDIRIVVTETTKTKIVRENRVIIEVRGKTRSNKRKMRANKSKTRVKKMRTRVNKKKMQGKNREITETRAADK